MGKHVYVRTYNYTYVHVRVAYSARAINKIGQKSADDHLQQSSAPATVVLLDMAPLWKLLLAFTLLMNTLMAMGQEDNFEGSADGDGSTSDTEECIEPDPPIQPPDGNVNVKEAEIKCHLACIEKVSKFIVIAIAKRVVVCTLDNFFHADFSHGRKQN